MIGVAIGPPQLDAVPADGSGLFPLGMAGDINIETDNFDSPVFAEGGTLYMPSRRSRRLAVSDVVISNPRMAEQYLATDGRRVGVYVQMEKGATVVGAYLSGSHLLCMDTFWAPEGQLRARNLLFPIGQWTEVDRRRLMLPWQAFEPLSERELVGMDWGSEPSRTVATVVDMGRNMQGETVEFQGLDEWGSIDWDGYESRVNSVRRQIMGEPPVDDEPAKEDRLKVGAGDYVRDMVRSGPAPRRPALPKPDPVRRSREVAIAVGDEADVTHRRTRTIMNIEDAGESVGVRKVRTLNSQKEINDHE